MTHHESGAPDSTAREQDGSHGQGEHPEHTDVAQAPTVASVAAVVSTTEDLEAAQPSHPDRPVGVNVDTASLGTEPDANETPDSTRDADAPQDGTAS